VSTEQEENEEEEEEEAEGEVVRALVGLFTIS